MPPRPPLDGAQTRQALEAYQTAREQAVRYVLAALDPTAFDAPARPYLDVLVRVQELIMTELRRYTGEDDVPPEAAAPTAVQEEEPAHG